MIDPTSELSLEPLLAPASVAVIGASDNPHKVGGRPVHYLKQFGFGGPIYPVNPNRDTVQGIPSYPDMASLPDAPDMAVIAVPGPAVADAVDACAERGVKVAVIMASGFGETLDADSAETQRAMAERAAAAGMRLVGPNAQGTANFGTGAVVSFSTMFLEVAPEDGPAAILSQSGSMSSVPYALLREKGIGVRHVHATGNEADVDIAELALAVAQDPGVELMLLYLETIRDADTLARAAGVARESGIPVVALKAGRTRSGKRAARTHTGALAQDDRVVDAFFRKHGIWRVRTVPEWVGAAELYLKGWRPERPRLVVVSNSGASCVMAADRAEELGLELPSLAETTGDALLDRLPSFATTTNPIDVTGALLSDSSLFGRILEVLEDEPAADLLLVALPVSGAGYDVEGFADAVARYAASTGRVAAVATPWESVAGAFRERGVPTFGDEDEAMVALAQLAGHTELLARVSKRSRSSRADAPGSSGSAGAPIGSSDRAAPSRPHELSADTPSLSEAESLRILGENGLPVVSFRLCDSEDEAVDALREIGGPVVLKASSASLPHKSEHGLVLLGIDDEEGVRHGYRRLNEIVGELGASVDPPPRVGGILVARQEPGRREMVLGAVNDPVFGPVVMIGDGGVHVEALGDVVFVAAPFEAEEALEAMERLRIAPLFEGVRGAPPLDVEALADAAAALGDLTHSAGDSIGSVDLNPVLVRRRGEGVVIVDALIEGQIHGTAP